MPRQRGGSPTGEISMGYTNKQKIGGLNKMEIKHRFSGKVLFESQKESLKEAVVEADREKADLRGADLVGAYLEGANLVGVDLRGADLRGADLRGADLEGAYLEGANLVGVDLRGADLVGANLRGIKITLKEKEFLDKWFAWEIIGKQNEKLEE